jgi:hypothetical protein
MTNCNIHKDQPTCHTCNNYGSPECPFYPEEPTFPEGDGIGACIRHPFARAAIRNEVLDELITWLEPQTLPLLKQKVYRKLQSLKEMKK